MNALSSFATSAPTPQDAPAPVDLSLGELCASLRGASVVGDASVRVHGVFQDSRRITRGAVFAVRDGARTRGRDFVEQAVSRGAAALLTADPELAANAPLPVLLVPSMPEGLAKAALAAYGNPETALTIVGITGTNGKTTTTHLVTAMLNGAGKRAAALGTLGTTFEGVTLAGPHTTPEADDLARSMAALVTSGATHLTMEVSSHALVLGRVLGVPFRVTAFLNLTHDHLDFHGTLAAYGDAKRSLFTDWPAARAVVNIDDPFGQSIADERAFFLSVSPAGAPQAEIRCVSRALSANGLVGRFATPRGLAAISSSLVGSHNLENLAVALGIGIALDLDVDKIAAALSAAPAVPGRLERCSGPEDAVLVVVDYAHTPDALLRALSALRPFTQGALVCVFGCGGDRDASKRPAMGRVAGTAADRVILTDDNPRSERGEDIVAAIVPGVLAAGKTPEICGDRRAAIRRAVGRAEPGDTVLIAGKGHEPYQIIGPETLPFDDRVEARAALHERGMR